LALAFSQPEFADRFPIGPGRTFVALPISQVQVADLPCIRQECGMLQLVFSVCSIVEGAACHELAPIPLKEDTTMVGCLMASQVEGAKWVASHPNQYISRITCQPAGRFAKI
jgi:hypothetical protein